LSICSCRQAPRDPRLEHVLEVVQVLVMEVGLHVEIPCLGKQNVLQRQRYLDQTTRSHRVSRRGRNANRIGTDLDRQAAARGDETSKPYSSTQAPSNRGLSRDQIKSRPIAPVGERPAHSPMVLASAGRFDAAGLLNIFRTLSHQFIRSVETSWAASRSAREGSRVVRPTDLRGIVVGINR
jgi:hypothetical protein